MRAMFLYVRTSFFPVGEATLIIEPTQYALWKKKDNNQVIELTDEELKNYLVEM